MARHAAPSFENRVPAAFVAVTAALETSAANGLFEDLLGFSDEAVDGLLVEFPLGERLVDLHFAFDPHHDGDFGVFREFVFRWAGEVDSSRGRSFLLACLLSAASVTFDSMPVQVQASPMDP